MTGLRPTRERILDAVAELAGESGLPDADTVARRAGIGRSTLYRHFSGIEAMLEALIEEATARGAELVEQHLGAALRGEPGAHVLDGFAGLFEAALNEPSRYRLVMRRDPGAVREIGARFEAFTEQVLQLAQRRGELRPELSPVTVNIALIWMNTGLLAAVDRDETSIDEVLLVFERLLASLRP